MEPQSYEWNTPQYTGVNLGSPFTPNSVELSARNGQASPADVLLAINRMMNMAPARSARVFPQGFNHYDDWKGVTPIQPVIPSDQAAKEARVIYDNSGARLATSQEQQMALVQALMQKLGIF